MPDARRNRQQTCFSVFVLSCFCDFVLMGLGARGVRVEVFRLTDRRARQPLQALQGPFGRLPAQEFCVEIDV